MSRFKAVEATLVLLGEEVEAFLVHWWQAKGRQAAQNFRSNSAISRIVPASCLVFGRITNEEEKKWQHKHRRKKE
ncbi:MAG: hypothetical protein P8182_19040 [Deltaproteobacteria bacterium]